MGSIVWVVMVALGAALNLLSLGCHVWYFLVDHRVWSATVGRLSTTMLVNGVMILAFIWVTSVALTAHNELVIVLGFVGLCAVLADALFVALNVSVVGR